MLNRKVNTMEKSIEERIFEVRETIKQVISEAHLSPSIVELILRELYSDTKTLADINLRNKISERLQKEQLERNKEVTEDGEHKSVPD